jgi:pimeloyl-ACP methyl ester carboxylesterase
MPDFEPITGRYLRLGVDGEDLRVYMEEAGTGHPLVCLHTAAADTRQYRHVLTDEGIIADWRVIAFDMPYHGKSNPPNRWWDHSYRLSAARYEATIVAFCRALGLVRPVVMGCSMGGAIVLRLAARHGAELGGIIGLESAAYAPGRANQFLHHPAVHGGEMAATYSFGLTAPQSPEECRRENWWYYSQSGPGVYLGDIHFYSSDWDGREELGTIDTHRCPVVLLTGEYDYSCTPDMTAEVARRIPGSRYVEMQGIGHFPMVENPRLFIDHYLRPALDDLRARLKTARG